MTKPNPHQAVREPSLRDKLQKDWVTIHFKEDSIPSLRSGALTEESVRAILSTVLAEVEGLLPKKSELPDHTHRDARNFQKGFNDCVDKFISILTKLKEQA